jgi:hypothetical protein
MGILRKVTTLPKVTSPASRAAFQGGAKPVVSVKGVAEVDYT